MKVKNLGANKTQIEVNADLQIFVSYETPVAAYVDGKFYRTSEKFSRTTSKHITQWLDGVNATEKPQDFFENLLTNH